MRKLTLIDKLLLTLGFLLVIAIFTLVFVILSKSGQCVIDPLKYIQVNNITKGIPIEAFIN